MPGDGFVEVYGAGGGDAEGDDPQSGGTGGYVEIEVTSGTTLVIAVGETAGPFPYVGGDSPAGDGGRGGQSDFADDGGGGGGATVITRQSDGVELAAAGGGGGGAVGGPENVGGGGGARGGIGGTGEGGVDTNGEDGAGSGVGGDGGSGDPFARPGSDGGATTGGGVTVVETQTGGGNDGDGQVVVKALPAVPQNVDAAYVADDEIELSFGDNGAATSFDVEMRRDDGAWVSPAGGPSSPTSSGTYSYGPASDAAYGAQVGIDSKFEFRVRASNSVGTTDWAYSDVVYTTPVPPHNPSVSRPDADTIQFSWSNKSTIDHGVRVKYREDTGDGYGAWSYFANDTGWGSSVEFDVASNSKLSTDARYQFILQSYSPDIKKSEDVYADYGNKGNVYFEDDFESGDLSAWDNTSGAVATTDGSHPNAADTGVGGADTGSYFATFDAEGYVQKNLGDLTGETDILVRCALATGSMDNASEYTEIQWYDGSSWNTLDRLDWASNEQGWVEVHKTVPDSWLSADNRIRVIGVGGLGGGDQHAVDRVAVSDILHEYTTPAAPSELSLDASTNREIAATWAINGAVTDTAPGDVETYFGPDGGSLNGKNRPRETTSLVFDGLRDGERYRLEVLGAVHQYRRGSKATEWDSSRATAETTTILPAPTGLTTSGVTADSADLTWQASHNYGDTLVQYKTTDAGSWKTQTTVVRDVTSAAVTALRNGEAYEARVVANTEHTQTEDN